MRKLFFLLGSLFLPSVFFVPINAQVTIGSLDSPGTYEILRIDGNKSGLRLNRLTTEQREALAVENNDLAKGLFIFNSDTGFPEFWDGSEWRPFPINAENQTFENGLSAVAGKAQLGGTLIENTEIDQNGYNLQFDINGGAYSINTDAFLVDNSEVKADKLNEFLVNDTVFALSGSTQLSLKTGGTGFTVNDTVFNVQEQAVTIDGNFRYSDGSEKNIGSTKTAVLTAADDNGRATWIELVPSTSYQDIPITRATGSVSGSNYFTANAWADITDEFTLSSGKWMVLGHFTSYTSTITYNGTTDNNYMSELSLYNTDSGEYVYSSMRLPERKTTGGSADSGSYGNPSMIAFLNISQDTKYKIQFKTGQSNTWFIKRGWIPEPFFVAIRINN